MPVPRYSFFQDLTKTMFAIESICILVPDPRFIVVRTSSSSNQTFCADWRCYLVSKIQMIDYTESMSNYWLTSFCLVTCVSNVGTQSEKRSCEQLDEID